MFNNYYMPRQNVLPAQQVIQVNGKASVDTIQLAPNSSVLVMDTSAPLVWLCISDGVGRVTSTPYDISVHEEKVEKDPLNVEQRIKDLETAILELENKLNAKSNVSRTKPKQSIPDDIPD